MIPMNFYKKILTEKIELFLQKYNLLDKSQKFFVGFSGGIDSACLLDILNDLSAKHGFLLVAGHLNHNWRGQESLNEELNAKSFCNERNIKFYSETLDENLPHTEEEARNQRYKFFNKVSLKTNCTAIITGHTLSDNVETVLYRIIKGTGIKGLKGIPEKREQKDLPSIYRPMLEITREETIEYCKENNIAPNMDSSNLEEKYLRNKIRLSLIPDLKNYNSDIENAILRLSFLAKDSEEIIEESLKTTKQSICAKKNTILTEKFIELPESMQRRVLYDFLPEDLSPNYQTIQNILGFIKETACSKSGTTFSIGKDLWVFASSSQIEIIDKITADKTFDIIPVNLENTTTFPALNFSFKVTKYYGEKPEKFPKESDLCAYVDLSRIKTPLFLRTRRDGDRIQPFGMQSKTKLKKYLINKGIPEFERDKLLLLTTTEEILWVAGVGISELIRVDKIPTHKLEILPV
jgi:tRNA(Ile)-lysidine synthase